MSMIEDELRRVLDGHSADVPPTVDRPAELGRRIRHHQRVRVAVTAAAVAFALAVSGVAVTRLHVGKHADQAPAGTTFAPPGELPAYYKGGKLAVGATVDLAAQQSVTVTYTPTNWDMILGVTCVGAPDTFYSTTVNGHDSFASQCVPQMIGPAPAFDAKAVMWQGMGVELGRPMTVTVKIGHQVSSDPFVVSPYPTAGIASVGVYLPVPWAEYPFPPAPAGPPSLTQVSGDLSAAPIVAALQADDAHPDRTLATTFQLTSRLEVDMENWAPGSLAVYVDQVEVYTYSFYDWASTGGSEVMTVGQGRMASFHVGQTVTLQVVPQHFTGVSAWRVEIRGE